MKHRCQSFRPAYTSDELYSLDTYVDFPAPGGPINSIVCIQVVNSEAAFVYRNTTSNQVAPLTVKRSGITSAAATAIGKRSGSMNTSPPTMAKNPLEYATVNRRAYTISVRERAFEHNM